jgi:hypothetical protein
MFLDIASEKRVTYIEITAVTADGKKDSISLTT